MTMADVLSVTLILLGFLLTIPALWLFLRTLFPGAVARSREALTAAPGRCFLAGLLPAVVLLAGSLVALNQGGPPVKFLGLVLFSGGFLLAGVGLAALAAVVGDRLPSPADAGRPWRGQVRGAVCMELAFLLPVVGWFGLLPLAAVTCTGAACVALLRGPAATTGQPVAADPAAA